LLNNLFAKFHRTMAQRVKGEIAVSFPFYQKGLGNTLRLHGSKEALESLMAQPWLKGLRDYLKVNEITPTPKEIKGYRSVYRVQQKSPQNIRKRSVAKGWLTEQEALARIPDSKQTLLSLPFLQIKSLSSNQMVKLFVQLGELESAPRVGRISSYGFSKTATIPWF
jgi:CRISPR-associated endonuclease Csy4